MKRLMLTVPRPDIFGKYGRFPKAHPTCPTDYVSLPAIELRGTWMAVELIDMEQLANVLQAVFTPEQVANLISMMNRGSNQ